MRMTGHILLTMMRRGLPALAVYALLLQAFLVGAAPARAFDHTSAPICAEATENGAPAHGPTHHGDADCLCLASCLSAHAKALANGAAAPQIHAPDDGGAILATPLVFASAKDRQRLGPGARAPPRG
jgi:hypothetical protein